MSDIPTITAIGPFGAKVATFKPTSWPGTDFDVFCEEQNGVYFAVVEGLPWAIMGRSPEDALRAFLRLYQKHEVMLLHFVPWPYDPDKSVEELVSEMEDLWGDDEP